MDEIITFEREELIYEISNQAFVIADVMAGRHTPHALHQTFDICGEGNADRVRSLMSLAFAEVAVAVSSVGSVREERERFVVTLTGIKPAKVMMVREACREYVVAAVLHGWLSVTLPEAAEVWAGRKALLFAALRNVAASGVAAFSRRVPPI